MGGTEMLVAITQVTPGIQLVSEPPHQIVFFFGWKQRRDKITWGQSTEWHMTVLSNHHWGAACFLHEAVLQVDTDGSPRLASSGILVTVSTYHNIVLLLIQYDKPARSLQDPFLSLIGLGQEICCIFCKQHFPLLLWECTACFPKFLNPSWPLFSQVTRDVYWRMNQDVLQAFNQLVSAIQLGYPNWSGRAVVQ